MLKRIYKYKSRLNEDFISSYDDMDDSDDSFGPSMNSILKQQGLSFELDRIIEKYLDIVNAAPKKLNSLLLKKVTVNKKGDKDSLYTLYNTITDKFKTNTAPVGTRQEQEIIDDLYTSIITVGNDTKLADRELAYNIAEYDAATLILLAIYAGSLDAKHGEDLSGPLRKINFLASRSNVDEMLNAIQTIDTNNANQKLLKNIFKHIVISFEFAFSSSRLPGTYYCPKASSFLSEHINQFLDLWENRCEKILNDNNSHFINPSNICRILNYYKYYFSKEECASIVNKQYIPIDVFNNVGVTDAFIPEYVFGSVNYHYAVVMNELISVIRKFRDIINEYQDE